MLILHVICTDLQLHGSELYVCCMEVNGGLGDESIGQSAASISIHSLIMTIGNNTFRQMILLTNNTFDK